MGARGEAKVYRLHTWRKKYDTVLKIYVELARTGGNPPVRVSYDVFEQE
jgi:hypothetical protein